jgi:hypothetical protein
MKEQLITKETAVLGEIIGYPFYTYPNVPTQSFLQKWLREVHGINIFMTFKPNIKKWDFIPYFMSMDGKEYIKYNSEYTKIHNERRFDTYEEALELGLQEALKLIEK